MSDLQSSSWLARLLLQRTRNLDERLPQDQRSDARKRHYSLVELAIANELVSWDRLSVDYELLPENEESDQYQQPLFLRFSERLRMGPRFASTKFAHPRTESDLFSLTESYLELAEDPFIAAWLVKSDARREKRPSDASVDSYLRSGRINEDLTPRDAADIAMAAIRFIEKMVAFLDSGSSSTSGAYRAMIYLEAIRQFTFESPGQSSKPWAMTIKKSLPVYRRYRGDEPYEAWIDRSVNKLKTQYEEALILSSLDTNGN